jgi:hypothetical protein
MFLRQSFCGIADAINDIIKDVPCDLIGIGNILCIIKNSNNLMPLSDVLVLTIYMYRISVNPQ